MLGFDSGAPATDAGAVIFVTEVLPAARRRSKLSTDLLAIAVPVDGVAIAAGCREGAGVGEL